MSIYEFLYLFATTNPLVFTVLMIILSVVIIALFICYIRYAGLEKIKRLVFDGFVRAEKEFQHGDNEQKFEYVVQLARSHLPYPYKLFITEDLLKKTVQLWFDLVKKLLDY